MAAMTGAGHPTNRDQARAIIREILTGRDDVEHPGQFVLAAIRRDPGKYAPGDEAEGKRKPKHGTWCHECDPHTRQIELPDGRVARCPNCHALRKKLLPQYARCNGCLAVIYRTDAGLSCEGKGHHRVVEEWRALYDVATVEAGRAAQAAREQARRERAEHTADAAEAERQREEAMAYLHGPELAKAQADESRRRRAAGGDVYTPALGPGGTPSPNGQALDEDGHPLPDW
jgi:hypothetical protein